MTLGYYRRKIFHLIGMYSGMINGRPEIERRPDYLPRSPQEEFIVPLLKVAIEVQIDRLLSPGQSRMRRESLTQGAGRSHFVPASRRPEHPITRLTFVLNQGSKLIS